MDTAAVMTCVDLAVTFDTAVAQHTESAGAPGWVTLSTMPDCRWLSVLERQFVLAGAADLPRRTFK